MDDVALVIDEREAVRAHFVGSDDITAILARTQQRQTNGGKEQGEEGCGSGVRRDASVFRVAGGWVCS
jgi:hypothetical protein